MKLDCPRCVECLKRFSRRSCRQRRCPRCQKMIRRQARSIKATDAESLERGEADILAGRLHDHDDVMRELAERRFCA